MYYHVNNASVYPKCTGYVSQYIINDIKCNSSYTRIKYVLFLSSFDFHNFTSLIIINICLIMLKRSFMVVVKRTHNTSLKRNSKQMVTEGYCNGRRKWEELQNRYILILDSKTRRLQLSRKHSLWRLLNNETVPEKKLNGTCFIIKGTRRKCGLLATVNTAC